MFCVECGKETEIFKNGTCVDCYIKNKSFSSGPQIIDIYSCPKCSAYKYKNTWVDKPFDDILKRFIRDEFQISNELEKITIETDCDTKDKIVPCKVTISGFLNGHIVSEQHRLEVRLKRTTCNVCSKQYGGYFEAVLQIRTEKRTIGKNEREILKNKVEMFVESTRAKGNRGLFITDIGEEKEGIDFYLSEKGSAQTIAKKIQEQYGGEIKQSAKNIGMKDSKQIYRVTYLIRLPPYRKGDFISKDNSFFFISSVSGNKIHVFDLSSWSEVVLDEKDLRKATILGGSELVKEMILVSESQNEVQVMDQKTYQTFDVKKLKNIRLNSKLVRVVKLEERIFLVPEKNTIDK